MAERKISRREFLRGAAGLAGAVGTAGVLGHEFVWGGRAEAGEVLQESKTLLALPETVVLPEEQASINSRTLESVRNQDIALTIPDFFLDNEGQPQGFFETVEGSGLDQMLQNSLPSLRFIKQQEGKVVPQLIVSRVQGEEDIDKVTLVWKVTEAFGSADELEFPEGTIMSFPEPTGRVNYLIPTELEEGGEIAVVPVTNDYAQRLEQRISETRPDLIVEMPFGAWTLVQRDSEKMTEIILTEDEAIDLRQRVYHRNGSSGDINIRTGPGVGFTKVEGIDLDGQRIVGREELVKLVNSEQVALPQGTNLTDEGTVNGEGYNWTVIALSSPAIVANESVGYAWVAKEAAVNSGWEINLIPGPATPQPQVAEAIPDPNRVRSPEEILAEREAAIYENLDPELVPKVREREQAFKDDLARITSEVSPARPLIEGTVNIGDLSMPILIATDGNFWNTRMPLEPARGEMFDQLFSELFGEVLPYALELEGGREALEQRVEEWNEGKNPAAVQFGFWNIHTPSERESVLDEQPVLGREDAYSVPLDLANTRIVVIFGNDGRSPYDFNSGGTYSGADIGCSYVITDEEANNYLVIRVSYVDEKASDRVLSARGPHGELINSMLFAVNNLPVLAWDETRRDGHNTFLWKVGLLPDSPDEFETAPLTQGGRTVYTQFVYNEDANDSRFDSAFSWVQP